MIEVKHIEKSKILDGIYIKQFLKELDICKGECNRLLKQKAIKINETIITELEFKILPEHFKPLLVVSIGKTKIYPVHIMEDNFKSTYCSDINQNFLDEKSKFINYIESYIDECISDGTLFLVAMIPNEQIIPFLKEKKYDLIVCFTILNKEYTFEMCSDIFDDYIKNNRRL
jgi:hypothetical protein